MSDLELFNIIVVLVIALVWGWIRYRQTRDTVEYYTSLYRKHNELLSERVRGQLHDKYERAYWIIDGKYSYKLYYTLFFILTVLVPISLCTLLSQSIDIPVIKYILWIISVVAWVVFLGNFPSSESNIFLSSFKNDLYKISQYAKSLEYRDI